MKETETKTQNKPQSKGVKVVKTIINTIINILIVLVLVTSILIAVMALTSKANGVSTIFGYTIQPIQSDSMKGGSPDGYGGKEFEKGDLVIGKATGFDPEAEYSLGDIITYKDYDEDGVEFLMAHRIVDVKNQNGTDVYQTWGDNREVAQMPDQDSVEDYLTPNRIASVIYNKDYDGAVIKGVGGVLDYLKTQQGFFLVVLLPMIIFFMYALVRVVLSATGYKKTKATEEKDEAVKVAVAEALAEREKTVADGVTAEVVAGMSAEELEQFRQFQEFQKMQKAQRDAENKSEPPAEE